MSKFKISVQYSNTNKVKLGTIINFLKYPHIIHRIHRIRLRLRILYLRRYHRKQYTFGTQKIKIYFTKMNSYASYPVRTEYVVYFILYRQLYTYCNNTLFYFIGTATIPSNLALNNTYVSSSRSDNIEWTANFASLNANALGVEPLS